MVALSLLRAFRRLGGGDVRRDEFGTWLTGRTTPDSINTYVHGLKRLEEEAASSRGRAVDLDAEWTSDGFADLNDPIDDCRTLVAEGETLTDVGRAVFERLVPPPGGLPPSWRKRGKVLNGTDDLSARFHAVVGERAASDAALDDAVVLAMDALTTLRKVGMAGLRHGEVLSIALSVYGTLHPGAAAWFKVTAMRAVARRLTSRDPFAADLSSPPHHQASKYQLHVEHQRFHQLHGPLLHHRAFLDRSRSGVRCSR